MKTMLKFVRLIVAVSFVFAAPAMAQSYVRPSKGKAILLSSNPVSITSPLYDWTAFEGAEIFGINLSGTPGESCSVTVLGAPNTSTTPQNFTAPISGPVELNGSFFLSNGSVGLGTAGKLDIHWTPPYVQFQLTCTAGFTTGQFYVVPIPFSRALTALGPNVDTVNGQRPVIIGAVSPNDQRTITSLRAVNGPVVNVTNSAGISTTGTMQVLAVADVGVANIGHMSVVSVGTGQTQVVNISGAPDAKPSSHVVLQNTSTSVVFCGTSGVTTTTYGFALAAGTAANDGKGGTMALDSYGTDVWCIVAVGTANVTAFRW